MSIYFAVCQTKLQIVQSKLKKGVILNRGSMPYKRTERKGCKFSRQEYATSSRGVTQDCPLVVSNLKFFFLFIIKQIVFF